MNPPPPLLYLAPSLSPYTLRTSRNTWEKKEGRGYVSTAREAGVKVKVKELDV